MTFHPSFHEFELLDLLMIKGHLFPFLLQFWDNRVHNGLKYFLQEYYSLQLSQFKKCIYPKIQQTKIAVTKI